MSNAKQRSLIRAALNMRAASLVAYDELIFGGNWDAARARIKEAEKELRRVVQAQYPSDMEPMYFVDPFKYEKCRLNTLCIVCPKFSECDRSTSDEHLEWLKSN